MKRAIANKLTVLLVAAVLSVPLLQGCGGDDPGKDSASRAPGATSSAERPAEAERRPLAAVTDPAGAEGKTLSLSRVTVGAGAALDPHFHEGEQTARVEKGTLTYTVIEGVVPVYTGSPEGERKLVREIGAGETADVEAGQWVIEEESDVHAAENKGHAPVEIVLTSLLRTGAPPATPKTGEK